MRKASKPLIFILILLLALSVAAIAGAEDVPVEDGGDVPPPETPIPDPTVEPVPEPTPDPTAQPTENPGTVNLTVYAYAGGAAAQGYTVRIDSTDVKTNSEGKADFPGLTVEQHSIKLISPNGGESSGVLYMSRGGSTTITDKAMGGKYGLDIAGGVNAVYMNAAYNAEGAIDITAVSSSPLSPPPAPSGSPANPTQSSAPPASASAGASASGTPSGGGMSTAMIGMIAMIVIVAIGVTVIVVAVKKHTRKRREAKAMANAREIEMPVRPVATGGANKFEERPRNVPRRINGEADETEQETAEDKPKVRAKDRSRL